MPEKTVPFFDPHRSVLLRQVQLVPNCGQSMDILGRQRRLPLSFKLHSRGALRLWPVQRQTVNTFAAKRRVSLDWFVKASIDHTINNIGKNARLLKKPSLVWRLFY